MRRATHAGHDPEPALGISIHALHEESDEFVVSSISSQQKFQSTLSMRRATFDVERCDHLRGRISIHALHEESDPLCCSTTPRSIFQSTLSMRRATIRVSPYRHAAFISIHALHEESDTGLVVIAGSRNTFQSTLSMRRATADLITGAAGVLDFNPRSP